jgi:hypothetical protein
VVATSRATLARADFRPFDARLLPNDNPNRPPRAVRYQIDPNAMTAKLVESVSDSQVQSSLAVAARASSRPATG